MWSNLCYIFFIFSKCAKRHCKPFLFVYKELFIFMCIIKMILFYSIGCNHSKMLLDNVSRYDKDKKIKLVPIDELKKQNINIEKRIHTVPAFMILPSKEILFGKDVFDYLLLPGRGILCSSQSTRLDRNINDNNAKIDSAIKPMEIAVGENDPLSFSLNSSKISDNFSTIEETDGICNDKSYNWDFINNDKNISDGISNININFDENKKSAMPTIEQLVKERDSMKL
jgi:hypothetical protein